MSHSVGLAAPSYVEDHYYYKRNYKQNIFQSHLKFFLNFISETGTYLIKGFTGNPILAIEIQRWFSGIWVNFFFKIYAIKPLI